MSISLECKKVKRTGFLPAFFVGSILAAAVPVINMAVRSEIYLNQSGSPIQILLGANWQMKLPFISYRICRQRYAENEIFTHSGKFYFL